MKRCNRCGIEKESTAFRRGSQCRACDKSVKLEWEKNNREKHLEGCRRRRREQIRRDPDGYRKRRQMSRSKHKETRREWRAQNVVKTREQKKRLYLLDPEKHKAQKRASYRRIFAADPEKYRDKLRAYRIRNAEHIRVNKLLAARRRIAANPEKYKAKTREYRNGPNRQQYLLRRQEENRKRRAAARKYERERWRTDEMYRLKCRLRWFLREGIKGHVKSARASELLGCSLTDFKIYLESKFEPGMTWENYGCHGWHIDHIMPLAIFDLANPEHQKRAFHFSNMQPLWAAENLSKSDKPPAVHQFSFL